MLGMLIVDDERIIREGIIGCTDWEEHGIEIVGSAPNVTKAMEIFMQKRPSIIMTDIKMPKDDGISLMQKIREIDSEVKIIVLSGYDDFKYAQKALHYSVFEYVLKPIRSKNLVELVKKAKEEIIYEQRKKDEHGKLWKQIEDNLPAISEQFIKDLVLGYQFTDEELLEKIKFLKLDINQTDDFLVMLISNDIYKESNFSEHNKQVIHYMILEEIDSILPKGYCIWSNQQGEYGVLFPAMEAKQTEEYAKTIINRVMENCSSIVTIGIGRTVSGLANIYISCREAQSALKYRLIVGNGQIINYEDIENEPVNEKAHYEDIERNVIFAFKTADKELLNEYIEKFFNEQLITMKPEFVKGFCMQLVFSVYLYLNQAGSNLELGVGNWAYVFSELENKNSFEQLESTVRKTLGKAMEQLLQTCFNESSPIIEEVICFLNEHYNETFSLKTLSNMVYLTPNYICSLFKQNTGQNISDYITNLRIEKAKELLKEPKYKIYEIANMVGYSDSRYFGSLFKKKTGLGLKEYRMRLFN